MTQQNKDFNKFLENITKVEKNARIYKILSEIPSTGLNNWMSIFSVTKYY